MNMQLACIVIIFVISLSSCLLTPVNWQQFSIGVYAQSPIQYINPEVLSTNFEVHIQQQPVNHPLHLVQQYQ